MHLVRLLTVVIHIWLRQHTSLEGCKKYENVTLSLGSKIILQP